METKKKLVVLITCGMNDERSSVAWSVANGGINSGLDVTVFLGSSWVDWIRQRTAETAHLNPRDPSMKEMIQNVIDKGNAVLVCPPCAKVRRSSEDDFLSGVQLAGSPAMHDLIKQGAATLSF